MKDNPVDPVVGFKKMLKTAAVYLELKMRARNLAVA